MPLPPEVVDKTHVFGNAVGLAAVLDTRQLEKCFQIVSLEGEDPRVEFELHGHLKKKYWIRGRKKSFFFL